jgi:hypothetical protein
MLLVETMTAKPTPTDPTKPDVSALAKLIGAVRVAPVLPVGRVTVLVSKRDFVARA